MKGKLGFGYLYDFRNPAQFRRYIDALTERKVEA